MKRILLKQNLEVDEPIESQDNVIHLFKNLSPTPVSDSNSIEAEQVYEENEFDHANAEDIVSLEESLPESTDSIATHSEELVIESNVAPESEEVNEIDKAQNFVSELDSEAEFDENDIEEEPELNVVDHLPESIIPGIWLEVYQGKDKAKRRLKFSKAINRNKPFSI